MDVVELPSGYRFSAGRKWMKQGSESMKRNYLRNTIAIMTGIAVLTGSVMPAAYSVLAEEYLEEQIVTDDMELDNMEVVAPEDVSSDPAVEPAAYDDVTDNAAPEDTGADTADLFSPDALEDAFTDDAGMLPDNGSAVSDASNNPEWIEQNEEEFAQEILNAGYAEDPYNMDLSDGMEVPEPDTEDEFLARALAFLQDPYVEVEPASAERIAKRLEELTRIPSVTGTDGELEIGQYIVDEMTELGYKVSSQSFHEGFLNEDMIDVPGINILAEREVNAANATDDILLVITHFDSKTYPEEDDPLANDKTGAAVVLEAAYLLANHETVTDVCFVFLSGEEDGYYGSASFLQAIEAYLGRVVGVICVGPSGYVKKEQTEDIEQETETDTEKEDSDFPEDGIVTEENGMNGEMQDRKKNLDVELFPYAAGTPDQTLDDPARMLLTSAAVQKLTLPEYRMQLEAGNGVETIFTQAEIMTDTSGITDAITEAAQEQGIADGIAETGTDGETAESEKIPLGKRFEWKLNRDTKSSASAFSGAGLETVYLRQIFTEETEEQQEEETEMPEEQPETAETETETDLAEAQAETEEKLPPMEADPEALAETADIVARAVAMYMAGLRF